MSGAVEYITIHAPCLLVNHIYGTWGVPVPINRITRTTRGAKMIRLIFRAISTLLLEAATVAATIAVILLALSAYLTARFVGVTVGKQTGNMMILARNLLAMGISYKRGMGKPKEAPGGES